MADQYQRVRDQFGPQADKYVAAKTFAQTSDLDWLVTHVAVKAEWSVLDVATGGGHAAAYFAPLVAKLTVTDLTEAMVRAAERHLAELGFAHARFEVAAAEALPFEADQFDCVVCRIAPHHFLSIPQFLDEVKRVLKPNGRFGLIDGIAPEDDEAARVYNDWERLRDPSHMACLSMSAWRTALKNAGFEVLSETTMRRTHNFLDYVERMDVAQADRDKLRLDMVNVESIRAWIEPKLSADGDEFTLHNGLFACTKS